MHNYVHIIEYGSVMLTCLHNGLLLRHLFVALAFLCFILRLHEVMAR